MQLIPSFSVSQPPLLSLFTDTCCMHPEAEAETRQYNANGPEPLLLFNRPLDSSKGARPNLVSTRGDLASCTSGVLADLATAIGSGSSDSDRGSSDGGSGTRSDVSSV